jgi:protein-L-isoaspartate(D-aspartate) O-methyltransferase
MNKDALLSHWRDRITGTVLEAFNSVPREDFVLPEMKPRAYEDNPLPILRSKTISQPSTVILMTEALELNDNHHVLEIGTGSGYQAAILSKIVTQGKITTTEVIPELVTFARANLKKILSDNVTVYEHDGSQGYPPNAPYDRIIFTAASPSIPLHLLDQLKVGGIMIVPVGDLQTQRMMKIVKQKNCVEQKNLGEFIFSPLVGKFGFNEEKL